MCLVKARPSDILMKNELEILNDLMRIALLYFDLAIEKYYPRHLQRRKAAFQLQAEVSG